MAAGLLAAPTRALNRPALPAPLPPPLDRPPGLQALRALRVDADSFEGKGSRGYRAFISFAKGHLLAGRGVVAVTYLRGSGDADYGEPRDDSASRKSWEVVPVPARLLSPAHPLFSCRADHIVPLVGIKAAGSAYSDSDVILAHSGFGERAVERRVGGYSCSAGEGAALPHARSTCRAPCDAAAVRCRQPVA